MTRYAGTTWTLEAALGQSPFTASPSWTDLSEYVRNNPTVTIRRGRATELDDVQPGSMTFQLDNRLRTFDPTYGPANIEFTGASTNYWSAGDLAAFSGATTLDIRFALSADDWTPSAAKAICAQYAGASNLSWIFYLNTDGTLLTFMSNDGTTVPSATSAVKVCGVDGQLMCVRVTWQSSDGATIFYVKRTTPARAKADTDSDSNWVQVGPTVTGLTSSLYNSTHPVVVGGTSTGGSPWDGKIYYGTITTDGTETFVFDPADAASSSATSWTSSGAQGETWSKTGSASVITTQGTYYGQLLPQTRVRFTATYNSTDYRLFDGFVEQWPQAYNGPTDAVVTVTAIDAFGIFANTPVANTPFGIAVAAEKATGSNIVGYWPMDEELLNGGMSELYSGLGGFYQGAVEVRDPIVPSSARKSKAFPIWSATAPARAVVTTRWEDTVGFGVYDSLCLQFWVDVQESNSEFDVIATIDDGGVYAQGLAVVRDPDDTYCRGFEAYAMYDVGGSGGYAPFHLSEGVHFVQVYNPGGAVTVVVDGVTQPSVNYGDGPASGAPFDITTWPTLYISGHGTVGGSTISDVVLGTYLGYAYRAGQNGRALELSGTRVGWLLDTIGWPSAQRTLTTDPSCYLAAAGGGGTALSQLKAINDAEQGRLYIGTDGKVIFRSRVWQRTATEAITSQCTFGDSGSEIGYSDIGIEAQSLQFVRNSCTVSTTVGTTVTYEDPTSIAAYGVRSDSLSSVPVTLHAARNLAADRVSRWGQPLDRIPAVVVEMLNPNGAGPATTIPAVLGLDFGHRVTVNRRPQSVGTTISGYFTVEGIQHTIGSGMWKVTLNLAPAPLTATEAGYWTFDDAFLSVIDSGVVIPY